LTLVAFFVVNQHVTAKLFSYEAVILIILSLAVAQLFVQLFFFLHMGKEKKPRWNLAVFISFIGVILLIVIASLWIMYHLNYNMTPHQMEQKVVEDELMELPGSSEKEMQKTPQNY
jgi:cytochrome o ubiquinol oxidase operon protein cyoD